MTAFLSLFREKELAKVTIKKEDVELIVSFLIILFILLLCLLYLPQANHVMLNVLQMELLS